MQNSTPELTFVSLSPPVMTDHDMHYNKVHVNGYPLYIAPKNVTLEMVRSQWKRWTPSNAVKTEPINKTFKVLSSNKQTYYNVTVVNNIKHCDCPAGMYRGKCKHMDQVKI